MSLWTWLSAMLHGRTIAPDPAKAQLTARQSDVARRLARMTGKTRDEVLADAYRRFDRRLRQR